MMNIPALAVAAVITLAIGRMLFVGSASADGQGLRREDQPLIYWSIVVIGIVADIALIYFGLSTKGQ